MSNAFYDCNIPPQKEGFKLIEVSEDIWKYEELLITRIEVIGKEGREFTKWLKEGHYEISMQDDGRTIKLFEKKNETR